MGSQDHVPPGPNNSVLTLSTSVTLVHGPRHISRVTLPPPSCATPLKVGIELLLTLPLAGPRIATLGAAAAVPAELTAIAPSRTAATRKSPRRALVMGSRTTGPRSTRCS